MSHTFDLLTTPIEPGTTLVEASAGTGKTYCLAGLVLRMLLEEKVGGIDRLLVVTFTNAATEELQTRIRDALTMASRVLRGEVTTEDPFFRSLAQNYSHNRGRDILRRALLDFDELMVATIHGFAKRVLEQSAFESGLPFHQEFLENDDSLLLEMARDSWRAHLYEASELVSTVVAERRLTPRSFLEDHGRWRRHPGTRIEPPTKGLAVATQRLEEAAQGLRKGFQRLQLQAFLGRLEYLSRNKLDRRQIQHLLGDLEAFCQSGDAAGLAAADTLRWSELQKVVKKQHHPSLQHHPTLAACETLSLAVDNLVHALRVAFIHDVEERFTETKKRAGILSFDDLLRRLHEALSDPHRGPFLARAVSRQYQAALIDEFQDTDLVQYEIFRRLFRRAPLYLIGDPKQAIYRFRGADVFAYMAAKRDAGRRYTLDRNWRSTHHMVEAVGAVFKESTHPFVYEEIPFEPVAAAGQADLAPLRGDDGTALTWLWLEDRLSRAEAIPRIEEAVAVEVANLLHGGLTLGDRPLVAGDIAVLARTNLQARGLQAALHRMGVPAVISRAGDVFESEEMAELLRLLQAVADPTQPPRLRAALATPLWGDRAEDLLHLAEDDDAWQQRVESFETYRALWRQRGFMPMMQQLIDEQGVRPRLLITPDGERRLTNLLHAVELLHQASGDRHLSPSALLHWLETERHHRARDRESAELRLESDARAVQISTIHKSKGLEYGVVFCPFLWESRPQGDPEKVLAHLDHRRVVYDCGSEHFATHRALAEAEALAEDLRLAYVALTRARYRTYVVWGQIGRKSRGASSPLAWLLAPVLGVSGSLLDEPPEKRVARVRADLQNRWDHLWESPLRDFAARYPELMEVRTLDASAPRAFPPADPEAVRALACRQLPPEARRRLQPWHIVSFTSLRRGEDTAQADLEFPALPRTPPLGEIPDHTDPPLPQVPAVPDAPSGIFAFAQGPRAGTCLHHVLEQCDLTAPHSEENHRKITRILERHGLHQAAAHRIRRPEVPKDFDPTTAVVDLLKNLATSPIPSTTFSDTPNHTSNHTPNNPFTLAHVPRSKQRIEWPFFTPLAAFVPNTLATLFKQHGRGRVATEYSPRLAHLDAKELQGFLTGFVDLVFVYQERWYVVDWKSNHLGDQPEDYGDDTLWHAMQHHHYVLQYHLYVLALHLFLEQRQPGYDYEEHFGGVAYVFLRGLNGGDPAPTGWYVDRPPIDLIDALIDLVDRREAA